jgi:hypothetical protein
MKTTARRRTLALFTALIMALALWTAVPLQASAADSKDAQDVFTHEIDGSATGLRYKVTGTGDEAEATITGFTAPEGFNGAVRIPSFVDGGGAEANIPVTAIGGGAFWEKTTLTSVIIPEGVTSIGARAFVICRALESITLPESLTSIGECAFQYGNSLTSVTISKNVTTIGFAAFEECGKINVDTENPNYSSDNGILFNKNMTTILHYPNSGGATTYEIPNTVTTLGSGVFSACKDLTSVKIPASVRSIPIWTFTGCTSLTDVNISEGVVTIGENAFEGVPLTSVTIPSSVTTIRPYAFWKCTALQAVYGMNGVTQIYNNAFQACTALTSFTIPSGVTTIQTSTFAGSGLTSITIPDTVTSIGINAFNNCASLGTVTILGLTTTVTNNTFTGANTPATQKIWCYNDNQTVKQYYAAKANIMIKEIGVDPATLGLDGTTQSGSLALTITSPAAMDVNAGTAEALPTEPDAILWTSSNQSLVSIDEDGNVTKGEGFGAAVITATVKTHSGVKTASATVTVAAPGSPTPNTLTVTNGTGGGSFAEGATVTITANDPVDTQVFDTWTGGEGIIDDPNNSTANLIMPNAETTVAATYKTKYATPTATVDFENGTLDGLTAGMYSFNGEAGVSIEGTTYNISDEWMTGSILSIVKKGDGVYAGSDAQSLIIPGRPDKPAGFSKTDETISGKSDGKITGVTDAMEYKTASGNWGDKAITDTEITGLAPGSYQVRFKATNSTFASKSTTIVIARGAELTYALTVAGGTGGGSFAAGATVTITANAPEDGKVFDAWTTSDGVTFADANSASTSFVMPAKAVAVTANYKDDPNVGGGDDPDPDDPPKADGGWVYESGVWKYLVNGEVATGWVHDGKAWYYLDSDGEMQTGWIHDGKAWYYLAGNGAMKTGWVKDNGSWYSLSGNGAMVAAKWFKDTDGNWYYLSGNGKMLTGKQAIGGKTYTFKANGVWVS